MPDNSLKGAQMQTTDRGKLQINVTSSIGLVPVSGATVTISYTGIPDVTIEKLSTDSSGQTQQVDLPSPPLEYSVEPSEQMPYSEYNIQVDAPGYESVLVSGTEILPDVTAIQPIQMIPLETARENEEVIVIPDHTLYGIYPPKIPEAEIKPMDESGEIVLSRVVIPEYVVVHDGVPDDSTAGNYYVRYRDYIKNVACSEIYSTWPKETIKANILAIMSFTLNRVYTEWYRNKGYNFTITSSTAFDHKWTYGQTIFDSISKIADEIFNNFISKPNIKQPILTQYCDGKRVMCPNWLSQWGSKYLGDDGLSYIDILRYYYGDNVYINQSYQISGIPASYPGFDLSIGSTGDAVLQIQEQLNTISNAYSSIKKISADGIYGPNTANAVKTFQNIFNLPISSIVDFPTWYKISQIYVGVSKIGENIN